MNTTNPLERPWNYFGVNVYPIGRNSQGLRWYARMECGYELRSDTKGGMRQLIREQKQRGNNEHA